MNKKHQEKPINTIHKNLSSIPISDALYSKFSCERLRQYWTVLMKQYRLYAEHRHQLTEPLKNENIFKMMSFVVLGNNNDERSHEPIEYITFEDTCKVERDDHRNPIVDVLEDPEYDESYDNSSALLDESQNYVDENAEDAQEDMLSHGIFGHEPKKPRYSSFSMKATPSRDTKLKTSKIECMSLDEFDYFGKKVAMQLRNLSNVNQKLSRKAEIEVLQLLMKYEESAEGSEES
jgi:hypothetical protein